MTYRNDNIYKMTISHYKLRITLIGVKPEDVLKVISTMCKDYSYVFEKGKQEEKPHYHFYLLTDFKNDTMRTKIRKLTGSKKGNKLYSLVKLEVEETYAIEYLAYMMKEGEVKYIGKWSEEIKDEARCYDEKVKMEIKEKKENRKSRYKKILIAFEEKFPSLDNVDCNAVIMFVINYFGDCEDITNATSISTIESYCNTLLLKYNVSNYRSDLSTNIHKRLFKI